MILGEKYGNGRSIRGEDLFFRDNDDFGKKKEIRDQALILGTPIFGNPCLGPLTLNIRHCSFVYKQRN